MQVEIGKIYVFRSVTGEELVAKVVSINDDEYVLSSPLGIGMAADRNLQFMPPMATAEVDAEVLLNKTAVGIISRVREDIEVAYIESVSGIKLPKAKQIITG